MLSKGCFHTAAPVSGLFKSKDADALTAAFREYSGKVVKSQSKEKPSIRKQLSKLQEVVKDMAKSLSRNKSQEVDR